MSRLRRRPRAVGAALAAVAVTAAACSPDAGGRGGGGDAEPLTVNEAEDALIWLLPTAAPTEIDNDEDRVYRRLDEGRPEPCAAALDELANEPAPARFATGRRGYHTFLAGAHLCLGDRRAARLALRRALDADWRPGPDRVTAQRACAVWSQVTTLVEGAARPCDLTAAPASGS